MVLPPLDDSSFFDLPDGSKQPTRNLVDLGYTSEQLDALNRSIAQLLDERLRQRIDEERATLLATVNAVRTADPASVIAKDRSAEPSSLDALPVRSKPRL